MADAFRWGSSAELPQDTAASLAFQRDMFRMIPSLTNLFFQSFWHINCKYIRPKYRESMKDYESLSGIFSAWPSMSQSFWQIFWHSISRSFCIFLPFLPTGYLTFFLAYILAFHLTVFLACSWPIYCVKYISGSITRPIYTIYNPKVYLTSFLICSHSISHSFWPKYSAILSDISSRIYILSFYLIFFLA